MTRRPELLRTDEANAEERTTYGASKHVPRARRQQPQRFLACDHRRNRHGHKDPAPAEQCLDLPKSHLSEQPAQLSDRVLLQMKSRRHRVEVLRNIVWTVEPVRGDADVHSSRTEGPTDPLELLQRSCDRYRELATSQSEA